MRVPPTLRLPSRSRLLTGYSRKPQQRPHGDKRGHATGVLHRSGEHVAHVGVEALLVVRGQAQAREAAAPSVALGLQHQRAAVTPPALRPRHHNRFHKEAAAVPHHPGQAGVADQLLCPSASPQQRQGDRELCAGLLQGVDPRRLAPLPLRVDQVGAGHQQVRPQVDGHCPGRLRLAAVSPDILNLTVQR